MQDHYATTSNNPIRKHVFQKKWALNRWLSLVSYKKKWGVKEWGRVGMTALIALAATVGTAAAEIVDGPYHAHPNPGDFTGDGITNLEAYAIFAANFNTPGYPSDKDNPSPDMNNDGMVDSNDLPLFTDSWLKQTPTGAVMRAEYYKTSSEESDEGHPWIRTVVTIYNTSPDDADYDMKKVTFKSGSNNGVNWVITPGGWNEQTDPNEVITSTPGSYIPPNGRGGLFELYAVGDSNHLEFKRDLVTGETRLEEEFTPLIIELPK